MIEGERSKGQHAARQVADYAWVEGRRFDVVSRCVCPPDDMGWGCCCARPRAVVERPEGAFVLVPAPVVGDDTPPREPSLTDLVHELHTAVYGDSWARSQSPKAVWEWLLANVRDLAQGQCGECMRRAARGDVVLPEPAGDEIFDDFSDAGVWEVLPEPPKET